MLTIDLEQDPAEYRPDDPIRGTLLWDQLEEDVERLELRLIWYTEGKGTQDVDVAAVEHIPAPGTSGRQNFEINAARRPISFSGKLISLIWALEAIEFPSQDAVNRTITISPSGKEIRLEKTFEDRPLKGAFRFTSNNR